MVLTKPIKHFRKSGYISKEKKMIGGKNMTVYTGLRGGEYHIKGGVKVYLKGGTPALKNWGFNNGLKLNNGAQAELNNGASLKLNNGAPNRLNNGAPPKLNNGAPNRLNNGAPPKLNNGAQKKPNSIFLNKRKEWENWTNTPVKTTRVGISKHNLDRIIEPRTLRELNDFSHQHSNDTFIFSNEPWLLLKDETNLPFYWKKGSNYNSATRKVPEEIIQIMKKKLKENTSEKNIIVESTGNKKVNKVTHKLSELSDTISTVQFEDENNNQITFTSNDPTVVFENSSDFVTMVKRMVQKTGTFQLRFYTQNAIKFIRNLGENTSHIVNIVLDSDKRHTLVYSSKNNIDKISVILPLVIPIFDLDNDLACFTMKNKDNMKTLNFKPNMTITHVEFTVKGILKKIPLAKFLGAARKKKDLTELSKLLGDSITLYTENETDNPVKVVSDLTDEIVSLLGNPKYIIITFTGITKKENQNHYNNALMHTYGNTIRVMGEITKLKGVNRATKRNVAHANSKLGILSGRRKWGRQSRNVIKRFNNHIEGVLANEYGEIDENTKTLILQFQSEINKLKNLDKKFVDVKTIFKKINKNNINHDDYTLLINTMVEMGQLMIELKADNPKLIADNDGLYTFLVDSEKGVCNLSDISSKILFPTENLSTPNSLIIQQLKDHDMDKYLSSYFSRIDKYMMSKVGQYSSNFKGLKEGSMRTLQWLDNISWSDESRLTNNGSDLWSFYEHLNEFRKATLVNTTVNNTTVNHNNPTGNGISLDRQLSKASVNGIATSTMTRINGIKKDLIRTYVIKNLKNDVQIELRNELQGYLNKSLSPTRVTMNNSALKASNMNIIQKECAKISKKYQVGGLSSKKKKVRKHQGIYQSGPKVGQLKSGFRYTGKKTTTGLRVIAKK